MVRGAAAIVRLQPIDVGVGAVTAPEVGITARARERAGWLRPATSVTFCMRKLVRARPDGIVGHPSIVSLLELVARRVYSQLGLDAQPLTLAFRALAAWAHRPSAAAHLTHNKLR